MKHRDSRGRAGVPPPRGKQGLIKTETPAGQLPPPGAWSRSGGPTRRLGSAGHRGGRAPHRRAGGGSGSWATFTTAATARQDAGEHHQGLGGGRFRSSCRSWRAAGSPPVNDRKGALRLHAIRSIGECHWSLDPRTPVCRNPSAECTGLPAGASGSAPCRSPRFGLRDCASRDHRAGEITTRRVLANPAMNGLVRRLGGPAHRPRLRGHRRSVTVLVHQTGSVDRLGRPVVHRTHLADRLRGGDDP